MLQYIIGNLLLCDSSLVQIDRAFIFILDVENLNFRGLWLKLVSYIKKFVSLSIINSILVPDYYFSLYLN
jgi:hypothetical protein